MKMFAALTVTTLMLAAPNVAAALSPAMDYTPEQRLVCAPHPEAEHDTVDDKAMTSSKTIWAKSIVEAPEGRVFDPRDEAIAYEVQSFNWGQNGRPVVIERANGIFPVKIELATKDYRGRSGRTWRTMKAQNQIVAMTILATPECFAALRLFDFSKS